MKRFYLVLFSLTLFLTAKAQLPVPTPAPLPSQVKLLDLAFFPVLNQGQSSGDSTTYQISFKINNAAIASQAILNMGTAQGLSDIKLVKVPFVVLSGINYIGIAGAQTKITRYQASFLIKVSKKQTQQIRSINLYVIDKLGLSSNKLIL